MATQAERRAETREKLLNSAKILFEEKGYEPTSVDRIIKLANIAKGTFYQHFESKLEILLCLEREAGRARTQQALSAIAAGAPALPILESYLESLALWFEAREKIAEAMILSSLSKTDNKASYDPELSSRGFIHAVLEVAQQQNTIRQDADTWELTGMIVGFITVSVLCWSRNPQAGQLSKALYRCLTIFLQGAQTQAASQ